MPIHHKKLNPTAEIHKIIFFPQKWNLPNTSQNLVNFQDHPYPPKDRSENYPLHHIPKNIVHRNPDQLKHLKM